ncbi:PadR family transcriptional regulator [Sphingomicrobium flavum]|uniref:PadR family transcriptional regulator n=1 Tax=Sphingomicrobium flavum TaxID=1229164 RepID=UPI0021ADB3C3|nr:PadR family transcriptional regulator [Sphingomicrobium flavum]
MGRMRFGISDDGRFHPFFAMGGRHWEFGPGGFNFNWGPRGPGGGSRRGGGRRRMFDSGQLRLVLLKLVADEPRHGYDLIRALEEMTGGSYSPSPGTVYPTLTLLEEMGLIEERKSKGSKRLFGITSDGEAYLEERAEEVDRLMARLERHGERHERVGRPELKTAIAGVMTAMWHKVAAEEADDERMAEIAAILEKAAKKIEAL